MAACCQQPQPCQCRQDTADGRHRHAWLLLTSLPRAVMDAHVTRLLHTKDLLSLRQVSREVRIGADAALQERGRCQRMYADLLQSCPELADVWVMVAEVNARACDLHSGTYERHGPLLACTVPDAAALYQWHISTFPPVVALGLLGGLGGPGHGLGGGSCGSWQAKVLGSPQGLHLALVRSGAEVQQQLVVLIYCDEVHICSTKSIAAGLFVGLFISVDLSDTDASTLNGLLLCALDVMARSHPVHSVVVHAGVPRQCTTPLLAAAARDIRARLRVANCSRS